MSLKFIQCLTRIVIGQSIVTCGNKMKIAAIISIIIILSAIGYSLYDDSKIICATVVQIDYRFPKGSIGTILLDSGDMRISANLYGYLVEGDRVCTTKKYPNYFYHKMEDER